jgi:hypothetical protein
VQALVSSINTCFASGGRQLAATPGTTIFFRVAVEGASALSYAGSGSLGFLVSTRDGSGGFFSSVCAGFAAVPSGSLGLGGIFGVMFDGNVNAYQGIGASLEVQGGSGLVAGVTVSIGFALPPVLSLSVIVGAIEGFSVSLTACGTVVAPF